jgi:hypothetical protein
VEREVTFTTSSSSSVHQRLRMLVVAAGKEVDAELGASFA